MSTMRIVTPKGEIREVDKVVPIVEKRFDFNGQNRRFVEVVKKMGVQPTALALHYADNAMPFSRCFDTELFVGNLSYLQLTQIQQSLAQEGFYDFSSLEYQDVKCVEKTAFDEGESKPYTSDVTTIDTNFTGSLFGAGYNNMGGAPVMIDDVEISSPCDGIECTEDGDDEEGEF